MSFTYLDATINQRIMMRQVLYRWTNRIPILYREIGKKVYHDQGSLQMRTIFTTYCKWLIYKCFIRIIGIIVDKTQPNQLH